MKSTIRVDFAGLDNVDGFQPVIRVNLEDSEDVRDTLLKTFFQSLGGESSWLTAKFEHYGEGIKWVTIYPVKPSELQETIDIIGSRIEKPVQKATDFFSRFAIGDSIAFTTPKAKEYAFQQAKKKYPTIPEDEVTYLPEYFWGKITAVKFTEAKVWYDVLDDYSGKIFEQIPSHDVKLFSEETIKELKGE